MIREIPGIIDCFESKESGKDKKAKVFGLLHNTLVNTSFIVTIQDCYKRVKFSGDLGILWLILG